LIQKVSTKKLTKELLFLFDRAKDEGLIETGREFFDVALYLLRLWAGFIRVLVMIKEPLLLLLFPRYHATASWLTS